MRRGRERSMRPRKFGVRRQSGATTTGAQASRLHSNVVRASVRQARTLALQSAGAAALGRRTPNQSLNSKSRHLSAAKGQAGDGIFFGKQNSQCGLNAFSRAFVKLQKRSGRSPDFASQNFAKSFTVARPCGILTRFPILPAFMRGT
jgi:hypothetical protein